MPQISSFDDREPIWNPSLPLLFQWESAGRRWPISPANIRKALNEALAAIGLIDENDSPLRFQPHEFRRILRHRRHRALRSVVLTAVLILTAATTITDDF
ncbi:hypothetical protein [Streptomyces umbrinus]|uniref:hypothetical protein n=1 Tax=Streptomyces umbrinus TaxID=67370 RepID=UPI003C2F8D0A